MLILVVNAESPGALWQGCNTLFVIFLLSSLLGAMSAFGALHLLLFQLVRRAV
jgi:hypothetical protein